MSSTYYVMNYLANQSDFNPRVTFCCVQQSETFINSALPQFVSLANALLTGNGGMQYTFVRMVAAGPGMAEKADTGQTNDLGQPIVDQSLILDADILAAVQSDFPTVAGLYFNEDGTPITPAP
jgi:hypothetical protein